MDSIIDQIQGETGEAADTARSHIKRIRQLIRTNKDKLYEPDEDGSEDEGEDEEEEPIYFTTETVVDRAVRMANNMPQSKVEEGPTIIEE